MKAQDADVANVSTVRYYVRLRGSILARKEGGAGRDDDLPGLTGVAVDPGVVPKANVGAGADVDVPKPLPNDILII